MGVLSWAILEQTESLVPGSPLLHFMIWGSNLGLRVLISPAEKGLVKQIFEEALDESSL